MSQRQLPQPFRGIVPPMVTPLDGPDALDRPGLERLIEHLIDGGVHGLFILGTTGDGPALSYRLRREVIQRTCAQVAGRIPVLVGVTDTSYTESMHIAEFAAGNGADAIVMAPPYYFHVSQSDLLRLVEGVGADSALPLYLYNMPGLTKMHYEPETVRLAAEMSHVYGLKDSSGDVHYLAKVLETVRGYEAFTVLLGPEHLLLEGLRAGVHGGVCGGANLMPRLLVDLFEAFRRSEHELADRLQARVVEIGSPLYEMGESESSYIRGLKAALSVAGICSGQLPWPYLPAEPEQIARIREHLSRYPETQYAGAHTPSR